MGQSGELQGCRILVVEDDFLVAQGLCGMPEEAAATIVGPFGRADEALKFVESHLNASAAPCLTSTCTARSLVRSQTGSPCAMSASSSPPGRSRAASAQWVAPPLL